MIVALDFTKCNELDKISKLVITTLECRLIEKISIDMFVANYM
jgi:hypothetical protein